MQIRKYQKTQVVIDLSEDELKQAVVNYLKMVHGVIFKMSVDFDDIKVENEGGCTVSWMESVNYPVEERRQAKQAEPLAHSDCDHDNDDEDYL